MADMEVLAPGGHQHLVDKIKEQLAMKADASLASAVEKVVENQPTAVLGGTVLTAADAYAAPPVSLTVDGRSTQVSTTGKNMVDPSTLSNGYIKNDGTVYGTASTYKHTDYLPVTAGETYRVSQGGTAFNAIYTAFYDESKGFLSAKTQNHYTAPTYLAPEGAAYMRSSFNSPQDGYAMVQVDSGTWGGFEPYSGGVASPSPSWPQEIESIDSPYVIASGKNIFDMSVLEQGSWDAKLSDNDSAIRCRPKESFNLNALIGSTVACTGTCANGTFQWNAGMISSPANAYSAVGWHNSGESLTIPAGAKAIRFLFRRSDDTDVTPEDFSDIQIELSPTATAYEPYVGHTVPIYDGTLRSLPNDTHDELNLTYLRPSTTAGWAVYSRELVQRVMHSELTADFPGTWSFGDTPNSSGIYNSALSPSTAQFDALFPNRTASNNYIIIGATSIGVSNRGASANATMPGITAYLSTHRIYLRTVAQQDESTIAAMFAHGPVDIDYIAAEPITTQLDPIELPVLPAPAATVYSDPATGLAIEYVRDTEIVIDSLYAEIDRAHAAIAPVEHGTSSANYAVGSYLMLDGTFCKVTSAIATGETIAIGTNVVATTVDAELASLA